MQVKLRIRYKDIARIKRLEYLKGCVNSVAHLLSIRDRLTAITSENIMDFKMIIYRLNKRLTNL